MSTISIITVSFNSARTIRNTIDSVLSQDCRTIEYIVVDGKSLDGTTEILREYSDRISKLISEPDFGIYDAMNKGVAAARGEIIGFLNADDHYAHLDVIARVARTMREENLDALFGDVAFFNPDQPQKLVRRYRSKRFRPERVGWGWMPAHPALFVRREVFERVGPFRTDYQIAGDFEWVARAFRLVNLRYRYLPGILVHMRTGGISTGGWRNTLLLNREVMRACRENGISTNWLKILSKYPAKLSEYMWR